MRSFDGDEEEGYSAELSLATSSLISIDRFMKSEFSLRNGRVFWENNKENVEDSLAVCIL